MLWRLNSLARVHVGTYADVPVKSLLKQNSKKRKWQLVRGIQDNVLGALSEYAGAAVEEASIAIELSTLCDLKMFVYIYDPKQQRVIHYASDADFDLVDVFNLKT